MHPWITEGKSLWSENLSLQRNVLRPPVAVPRKLPASSLASVCKGYSAFETPFNDEQNVIPYFGTMFSLDTFDDPVEITTLELDLRDDMPVDDRNVMVYMYPGSYETTEYSSAGWTLVANATAQPLKDFETGAILSHIIPASNFTAFRTNSRTTVSLYVTMNGPYLDNTVYALDKTGEVAFTGDHFAINTGAGFSAPNFPTQGIDRTTEPKFSGVVHYKLDSACDDAGESSTEQRVTTTVEYHFIVNQIPSDDITSAVAHGLDSTVNDILQNDVEIQHYRTSFELTKMEGSVIVEASDSQSEATPCFVRGWTKCSVLTGRVSLEHKHGLSQDGLLYQMYNVTGQLMDAMESAGLPSETELMYIGHKSAAIEFDITLTSLPSGKRMNEVQTKFVTAILRSYLNSSLSTDSELLAVNINEWNPGESTNSSLQGLGSVKLTGNLYGLQRSFVQGIDLIDALNQALAEDNGKLVAFLRQQLMIPGPINQGTAFEIFRDVTSLNLNLFRPPGSNDDDDLRRGNTLGDESTAPSVAADNGIGKTIGIVIGVVGGILALLLIAGAAFYFSCSPTRDTESRYGKHSDTDEEEGSLPNDEELKDIEVSDCPGTRRAPVKSVSFTMTRCPSASRAPPLRSKSAEGAILYEPSRMPQKARIVSEEEARCSQISSKRIDTCQPPPTSWSREVPGRSRSFDGNTRHNLLQNSSSQSSATPFHASKETARPMPNSRSASFDVRPRLPAKSLSSGSLCGGVVSQAPTPPIRALSNSRELPAARGVVKAKSSGALPRPALERSATSGQAPPIGSTSSERCSQRQLANQTTRHSQPATTPTGTSKVDGAPLRRPPTRSVSSSSQARQPVQGIFREGRPSNATSRPGVSRSRSEPLGNAPSTKKQDGHLRQGGNGKKK